MTIQTEKETKERGKCNVRLSERMAQRSIKAGSGLTMITIVIINFSAKGLYLMESKQLRHVIKMIIICMPKFVFQQHVWDHLIKEKGKEKRREEKRREGFHSLQFQLYYC